MKLLILNWQDRQNPQAGGAEIHLHEIFGQLVERGHEVSLLASGWAGCKPRETLDGIEVHRVGSRHTFGFHAPSYYRSSLRAQSFDLLIEALNKVPLFSPLWAGCPVILLVHHLFGRTAFREAAAPIAALTWLLERPIPTVYRGLPAEAISESTASDLVIRGLNRSDIRVIHPGVDLEFFTPQPAARSEIPTFLYLGRLRRYKRVDLVVRAAARLCGEGIDVRVVIGGHGEYETQLRRLASRLNVDDRITFTGFVSEEAKRQLYREAWANVFPSPKEGWGITNIEAAACGTPSIASNAPGLRESVQNGRTGMLFPTGDEIALADAMRSLARDRDRTEALGLEAFRFAQDFSWRRAADETEAHLRELTPSTPSLPTPAD